jgi:hypothetical protein
MLHVFSGKYLIKAITNRSNNVVYELRVKTVRSDNGSYMVKAVSYTSHDVDVEVLYDNAKS